MPIVIEFGNRQVIIEYALHSFYPVLQSYVSVGHILKGGRGITPHYGTIQSQNISLKCSGNLYKIQVVEY